MNVGERIKKRRKQLRLSVSNVAEKLGVDRSTIYRYESSEIEKFPLQVIEPISKILNVSPAYLMGWEETEPNQLTSEYPYMPEAISAGMPDIIDGITDLDMISIPDVLMGEWAGNKNLLLMRINGESMNKIIPDNSLIGVNLLNEYSILFGGVNDGDIVVYSDDHEYAVKRFYRDGDKIIFRPESSDSSFYDYITDTSNENLKIHGKVVMWNVIKD